jgi:hypothetical protein
MNRDPERRQRATSDVTSARRRGRTPVMEVLEGRTLLSGFYTGVSTVRPVESTGGLYTFSVSGPGLLNVKRAAHGQFAVTLLGTTAASTLNETLTLPRFHKTGGTLPIASIRVVSGSVGSIDLPDATLNGSITPLAGSLSALSLGAIGTNAQVNVGGTIANLSVGTVGTNARVNIGGTVNALNLGAVTLGPTGFFNLGGIGQSATVSSLELDGGRFQIGGDVTGPLNFGSMTLTKGGLFSAARDVTGKLTVGGNIALSTNGLISVGRNLAGLTVQGNLTVDPTGGEVLIGGTLANLTINGTLQGKGTSSPDLAVGLDISSFNVLGGVPDQGGVEHASVAAGKDILALNVARGIFNSLITAGVLIDGTGGPSSGNIGPDGVDAVFNSEILAGQEINNITIDGTVNSNYVFNSNSTGYPTRIIAGEDRAGNFISAGLIDKFQITGSMIDSVLAASVAPSGGDGMLPNFGYGVAPPVRSTVPGDGGFNTYDAPAGFIAGGTVGSPIDYPNYSERSYFNETALAGTFYDKAIDPTIDDFLLFGAINPSFASPPLSASSLQNSVTVVSGTSTNSSTTTVTPTQQNLPLPSKSTVLGGVISTPHGDNADYAGIFATDTRGVFVGTLPT